MFEKREICGIFGPKREEVTGGWRKIHNEELHNLYSLSRTFQMMKTKRMKQVKHIVHAGEMRNGSNFG
jgi:hypothetical protein